MSPDDMIDILNKGGGLILDAYTIPIDKIEKMAVAASRSKAFLVLRNITHRNPTVELKKIVALSKGHVIFEC